LAIFLFGQIGQYTKPLRGGFSCIASIDLIDNDPWRKEKTHSDIPARESSSLVNVPQNGFDLRGLSGNLSAGQPIINGIFDQKLSVGTTCGKGFTAPMWTNLFISRLSYEKTHRFYAVGVVYQILNYL